MVDLPACSEACLKRPDAARLGASADGSQALGLPSLKTIAIPHVGVLELVLAIGTRLRIPNRVDFATQSHSIPDISHQPLNRLAIPPAITPPLKGILFLK